MLLMLIHNNHGTNRVIIPIDDSKVDEETCCLLVTIYMCDR